MALIFVPAAIAGQFGTPKENEGTRIFQPAEHPYYSGQFHLSGQRTTLIGSVNDRTPWDHLDYAGKHLSPVQGTIDIAVNELTNTGQVIVETFDSHRDDPVEVPGALVANHGPFVWGEDAGASLKNAIICEAVAQMAIQTLALNPHADAPPYLLERHFRRKHGPDAYYGNPQAGQPRKERAEGAQR